MKGKGLATKKQSVLQVELEQVMGTFNQQNFGHASFLQICSKKLLGGTEAPAAAAVPGSGRPAAPGWRDHNFHTNLIKK